MYIKRHIEKMLAKAGAMFGAVLVAGSRQVGKTTLLRNAKPDLPYITLDDPIALTSARTEPGTFFKASPMPQPVRRYTTCFSFLPLLTRSTRKAAPHKGIRFFR